MRIKVGESRDRTSTDTDLQKTIRATAVMRSRVREFFDRRDFVEVVTPALIRAPDPALHIESFHTEFVLPGRTASPLYLSTSPEFHMKRLLSRGCERIYQIAHFFRNGEMTLRHSPEFIGLEWYQVGASVENIMDQTEELIRTVAPSLIDGLKLTYANVPIDLARPFTRFSVEQALRELAFLDLPADWDEQALRRALARAGIRTAPDDSFDDLVNRALLERVEPQLLTLGPVFLYDYPAPMAALARLRPNRPSVAERFELFIGGLELCNGYGELTDPDEQRARLADQIEKRVACGKPRLPLDEAFLQALDQGLPACGGNALGLDRLAMLLLGKERIEQVQAFPLSMELDIGES